ncbi:NAD(P)/FAD-dependent oxidoreductase [Anaerosporobacter sp.]|uniref:NAD(P)/FAD-dependent oxidoreductase n=1 Tax=Anaerosporobacter sp. TaxID=1872529 RepID=UPI00286F97FE|nr:NAD(P)/FAD-dependent oxidoreductase [Anaerosporobacter sp.]
MKKEIIIIGGGAAGMVAAISAAKNGASVTILEHKEKLGKKILATGNGKCNYTNLHQTMECYRSENISFIEEVFSHFNEKDTIAFFQELGIYPKSKNGYLYPNSEQASSVVDVLMMELKRLQVDIRYNENVKDIKPIDNGYQIDTLVTVTETKKGNENNNKKASNSKNISKNKREKLTTVDTYKNSYQAKKVIVATGGMASSKLGSDGSGYYLLKQLGHTIVPVVPALVQLKAEGDFFEMVAGVRCDARLQIFVDGMAVASEEGELQLTNYGISGIPVFQISRYAAKALLDKKQVQVVIDFLPQVELSELEELLKQRINASLHKTTEEALIGLLNQKLIQMLLSQLDKRYKQPLDISKLAKMMKQFSVTITDTNSFENAQVCAGGIDTAEITATTLESKLHQGLYVVGELLDVDGICGGYNLQWAWSTGYIAGKSATLK